MQTEYSAMELSVWSKFDHPNVLPLLGVRMGDQRNCYQFMPLMKGSLRIMMGDKDLHYHLLNNPKEFTLFQAILCLSLGRFCMV